MSIDPTTTRSPRPLAELPAELSPDQQRAADEISAGPRGGVIGPFIPLLRSPELMRRLQAVGAHLRFETDLPAELREFVVLLVARHWDQGFEWAHHHPLALAAGIDPATTEAIAAGRRPDALTGELAAAYDVVDELHRTRTVTDDTYARANEVLGEQSLVEVVTIAGYYGLLAMLLNTAATPAPDQAG